MMRPYATWTEDCQGKKDFDGPLLSVSTRYWPGPDGGAGMTFDTVTRQFRTAAYGKRPSACSSICLNLGPKDDQEDGGGHMIWRDREFEADTEAEVKALVETWVSEQMADIVALLWGAAVFTAP